MPSRRNNSLMLGGWSLQADRKKVKKEAVFARLVGKTREVFGK